LKISKLVVISCGQW